MTAPVATTSSSGITSLDGFLFGLGMALSKLGNQEDQQRNRLVCPNDFIADSSVVILHKVNKVSIRTQELCYSEQPRRKTRPTVSMPRMEEQLRHGHSAATGVATHRVEAREVVVSLYAPLRQEIRA